MPSRSKFKKGDRVRFTVTGRSGKANEYIGKAQETVANDLVSNRRIEVKLDDGTVMKPWSSQVSLAA